MKSFVTGLIGFLNNTEILSKQKWVAISIAFYNNITNIHECIWMD